MFDVAFYLTATNLEITDCAIYYEELEMLAGIAEEEVIQ
jgi:hypothetical protein